MARYEFESVRLGFRRFQETDQEAFAAMNAKDSVMKYFKSALSRQASDDFIRKIEGNELRPHVLYHLDRETYLAK